MNSPIADEPPDPAAGFVAKARWLMVIAGLTTLIAIAAVLVAVGYRVFNAGGGTAAGEVTALLPPGARVIAISAAGDRIVVTIESGGVLEARMFEVKTLKPAGILRFVTMP